MELKIIIDDPPKVHAVAIELIPSIAKADQFVFDCVSFLLVSNK